MTDVLDAPLAAPIDANPQTAPCACGSGLRGGRCCAMDLRRVPRAPADVDFDADVGRMSRAYNDGEPALAEHLALQILEQAPGHREALAALYNVCKDTRRLKPASILIHRLVALHPNDLIGRLILTQFLMSTGAVEDAINHGRRLVQLSPESAGSHLLLARAFNAGNMAVAAEPHFRRALLLFAEPDIETLGGLADTLRRLGRFDEAREYFARADALGPNYALLLSWATMEEADRRFEDATRLLERAAEIAPNDGRLAIARANLHRRVNSFDAAVDELDALGARLPDGELGQGGLMEKGRTLDAMGRYDEAFAAFDAAKARSRAAGAVYQAKRAQALVGQLKSFFTPGRLNLLPQASLRKDAPQPIFIVGFPRSGTTLIEQTLSSHPDISGGDELPTINQMAQRLPVLLSSPLHYPQTLSELWLGDRAGAIDTLRDHYLNEAARHGAITEGSPWFTDKMPLNETHLGLIHLLFPKSPIIHLVRHPMDVVLSVYTNGLTHGFNCASGLDTAATHFALIADLVGHYREVLPMNYLPVRYEDMVDNQEAEVKRLLDFIGLPFDARVLDFQDNKRAARTASYAQVTEKLYSRSRYRHRNYAAHLEPVAAILAPAIEKLGYAEI